MREIEVLALHLELKRIVGTNTLCVLQVQAFSV